jgi:predicted peptidase
VLSDQFTDSLILIMNGDADASVDVEVSRKMTFALKSVSASVRYTEFPGVDHNGAPNTAYARADLIEWMLRQRRP